MPKARPGASNDIGGFSQACNLRNFRGKTQQIDQTIEGSYEPAAGRGRPAWSNKKPPKSECRPSTIKGEGDLCLFTRPSISALHWIVSYLYPLSFNLYPLSLVDYLLAYSTARVSRMTITLICPGKVKDSSIFLAISRLSKIEFSSDILSLSTMTRSSRPA